MAFVHLHVHSDFSLLDGAAKVDDLVGRARELRMSALALTDHSYLFGIPDFDLACRRYNDAQKDVQQFKHDLEAYEKGWEIHEPPLDAPDAPMHDRAHYQWEQDIRAIQAGATPEQIAQLKPSPLIKPLFGVEANFVPDQYLPKGIRQRFYHIVLLAKNETGYHHLMKMMSLAASSDLFYYQPRTSLDLLRHYHEGLICLSGCMRGIIAQSFIEGAPEEACRWTKTFRDIFADDFYLEIMDHGLEDCFRSGLSEKTIAKKIADLGSELGIKVVATNDVHYLTPEDAPTQDILSCIKGLTKLTDVNRPRMQGTEYYLTSEAEMRERFSWIPEACDNTCEVAEKCHFELDWTRMYLPKFPNLNPGETSDDRLRKEAEAGLARRYGSEWRSERIAGISVADRFEYEYRIICDKGFSDYFLIVQEYVAWAKRNGISVGPGRGSAGGAIIAYALDITTFDPLSNGLMFERFLSPERTEMPDIDMDFDDERRLDVVQHVRELYGSDQVSHVITYSTIKAKQAINDAARVMGFSVGQGQKLSKMVAKDPSAKLKNVLHKTAEAPEQYSQEFEDSYNKNADDRSIVDAALSIEGLHRGEGVHACAVLITPAPVNDFVPTKMDTKDAVEITQYEGHTIADMGLLKMDFLGLRTLTVISRARENIYRNYGIDIDVDAIDMSDPEIFRLMREGRTAGVFQIESAGMTSTIKNMKPTSYKQIVALIALYRPGPLGAGMVNDYIDRMNGRKEIAYYDERLKEILEETYGTIVYQEQVMQISMKMSGFSAGESDKVRKAVAKKHIELMTETVQHWDDGNNETMYDHWMNGAERNGYSRSIAQSIWDDVLKFASYAFNKSHSAGYAILVMQTAWLKAHYPLEYMASVLTSYMGKTEKIVHYVSAYRNEGVNILPPDINESGVDFTAVNGAIRFGFAGIKGVGAGVAEAIIAEREGHGPFKTLHDYVDRMDPACVNRRVVEALIFSGAFDSTGYTRMQLARFCDRNDPENILDVASRRQKSRATGQISMFDVFGSVAGSGFDVAIPDPDGIEWPRLEKLAREFDVLGFYVSDHPLSPYTYALAQSRDYTLADLSLYEEISDPLGGVREVYKVPEKTSIRLAGMVKEISRKTTRSGETMATIVLEDMEGEATLVVFPRLYKQCAALLASQTNAETGEREGDLFVRVEGSLDRSDRGDQIICSKVEELLLDVDHNTPRILDLSMPLSFVNHACITALNETFSRYPGLDRVRIRVHATDGNTMVMELPCTVDATQAVLMAELTVLLGQAGSVLVV